MATRFFGYILPIMIAIIAAVLCLTIPDYKLFACDCLVIIFLSYALQKYDFPPGIVPLFLAGEMVLPLDTPEGKRINDEFFKGIPRIVVAAHSSTNKRFGGQTVVVQIDGREFAFDSIDLIKHNPNHK
jgi:hypothetical protein